MEVLRTCIYLEALLVAIETVAYEKNRTATLPTISRTRLREQPLVAFPATTVYDIVSRKTRHSAHIEIMAT